MWQKEADKQNKAADLVGKYLKLFFISLIPIFSINALVLFRKLRLNFFEHHIIAGFALLGMYICLLFGVVLGAYESGSEITIGYVINMCVGFVCVAFPAYVYFQCTREKYSILGFLWRIVLFYIVVVAQIKYSIKALNFLLNHI